MEERTRILNMVAEGKISVPEGENLLDALGESTPNVDSEPELKIIEKSGSRDGLPEFIYVKVTGKDNANIKIPIGLIRAGVKLTALIPLHARGKINNALKEKGIDLDINTFKKQDLDELIRHLSKMEINVDTQNGDKVRVFCA